MERTLAACAKGTQCYWVCPSIEPIDTSFGPSQGVEQTAKTLREMTSTPQMVAMTHGKFSHQEKDQALQDFSSGRCALLVTTTVIEVGIDVPNASIMVIEAPERLGLAQLHQLRGRVGRGGQQSYCVLLPMTEPDHPEYELIIQRLNVLVNEEDGWKIAEADLAMRGSGELFGEAQSGIGAFRVADSKFLASGQLKEAQSASKKLVQDRVASTALTVLANRWFATSMIED